MHKSGLSFVKITLSLVLSRLFLAHLREGMLVVIYLMLMDKI